MKKFDKNGTVGLMLSVGVGVATWMVYKIGRSTGEYNAYVDCSNQLHELVKKCKETL